MEEKTNGNTSDFEKITLEKFAEELTYSHGSSRRILRCRRGARQGRLTPAL